MENQTSLAPASDASPALAPAPGSAERAALAKLRAAITTYNGHGMPGFRDRAQALLAIWEADKVLGAQQNKELRNASQ